jgi:hypothetical protein
MLVNDSNLKPINEQSKARTRKEAGSGVRLPAINRCPRSRNQKADNQTDRLRQRSSGYGQQIKPKKNLGKAASAPASRRYIYDPYDDDHLFGIPTPYHYNLRFSWSGCSFKGRGTG